MNKHLVYQIEKDVDYDDYKFMTYKSCPYCDCDYGQRVPIIDYDAKEHFQGCVLCKTLVNFKRQYSFRVMLCYTKMSQIDIIRKTFRLYDKLKRIPYPLEIDKNIKIVSFPIYRYFDIYQKMNPNEKKRFKHIKILFSDRMATELRQGQRYELWKESLLLDTSVYTVEGKKMKILKKYMSDDDKNIEKIIDELKISHYS